jgi:hypothetical protein
MNHGAMRKLTKEGFKNQKVKQVNANFINNGETNHIQSRDNITS